MTDKEKYEKLRSEVINFLEGWHQPQNSFYGSAACVEAVEKLQNIVGFDLKAHWEEMAKHINHSQN